jgi:predicted O-methyltransferase YrrM
VSAPPEIPELVSKALRAAGSRAWMNATRTETGRLLAALAATCTGTIAECGTGSGVGAAWLRSGAPATTRVITVDPDAELVRDARKVLRGAKVDVLECDWRGLRRYAPFALLFVNAADARTTGPDPLLELVSPGGMIVIDDLVPCHDWPPRCFRGFDSMRLSWLSHPRLASVETVVAEDAAVLLAVRRS